MRDSAYGDCLQNAKSMSGIIMDGTRVPVHDAIGESSANDPRSLLHVRGAALSIMQSLEICLGHCYVCYGHVNAYVLTSLARSRRSRRIEKRAGSVHPFSVTK